MTSIRYEVAGSSPSMRIRRLASARSSQTRANRASSRSSATRRGPRSPDHSRLTAPWCRSAATPETSCTAPAIDGWSAGFRSCFEIDSQTEAAEEGRDRPVRRRGRRRARPAPAANQPGGSSCTRPAKSACRAVEVTRQISADSPGGHRQVEAGRLDGELRIALSSASSSRYAASVLCWVGGTSRPVCTLGSDQLSNDTWWRSRSLVSRSHTCTIAGATTGRAPAASSHRARQSAASPDGHGSGGIRLDQLEVDREPDFKIKVADPRQQPIEIGRRSRVGQAGAVGVRVEACARAPPMSSRNVSAPTAAAYSARPASPADHGERTRGAGIEDDALVARRFVLQVPVRARRCCIEPVAPGPHHPRGVVRLADAEHDFAGLQELPATEIGPAVAVRSPDAGLRH